MRLDAELRYILWQRLTLDVSSLALIFGPTILTLI